MRANKGSESKAEHVLSAFRGGTTLNAAKTRRRAF
jgi:hypothetical protein